MSKRLCKWCDTRSSCPHLKRGLVCTEAITFDDGYELGIQEANKWVDVDKELPKKHGWYLTVVNNIKLKGYYMTCKFDGKFPKDVIAWKPIGEYVTGE